MKLNIKQGCVTAIVFAIIFGFMGVCAMFNDTMQFLYYPPGLIVVHILGHRGDGAILSVVLTTPIFYGIVGLLIGTLSKTRRQTLQISISFAILLIIASISFDVVRAHKRHVSHTRLMKRLKQEAISKLETDPNDLYSLHWMGVHHFTRTHNYKEAEKYFRKIVDLQSNRDNISPYEQRSLIYLAIIYQSWGEYDKAENYHQQFIATEPDFKNDLALLNYNRDYLKKTEQFKKTNIK